MVKKGAGTSTTAKGGKVRPKPTSMPIKAAEKPYISREEMQTKVRRTIGWFNHCGNLKQPIMYKTVRETVENANPKSILKVLHELEQKTDKIENPTNWLKSAIERTPDLDMKVKKTIRWYNTHGGLLDQIHYDDVARDLAMVGTQIALQLLKGLEGKEEEIRNPTAWLCKAAQKKVAHGSWSGGGKGGSKGEGQAGWGDSSMACPGDLDSKVKKTLCWYNNHGDLQDQISYDDVKNDLVKLDTKTALEVLKGLDGKEDDIRNPTAWICKAAQKLAASGSGGGRGKGGNW